MVRRKAGTEQERLLRNIHRDLTRLRKRATPEEVVDQYMQYGWSREFLAAHVREMPGDIEYLQQLMSEAEQQLERQRADART